MSSVFEMREECMEGLYVLNPGPGQDKEVNEAFNIKKGPWGFHGAGARARHHLQLCLAPCGFPLGSMACQCQVC